MKKCIVILPILILLGCGRTLSPDDGFRFNLEMEDISESLLKKNGFKDFLPEMGGGGYSSVSNGVMIIYEQKGDEFIRRHAMIKYHGDTTRDSVKKFIASKGFSVLKEDTDSLRFVVVDTKFEKKYDVELTKNMGLVFNYPIRSN